MVGQNYGDPPPYIYFTAQAGSTIQASIAVTDGGADFTLNSIDLYSSLTPIPYILTGLLNNNTAFVVSGTVPNTRGNFALVINPDSNVTIDTLQVTLTNPGPSCCVGNPVGLDNIAVGGTTSSMPEPASLSLLLAGLACLCLLSRRMRSWIKAAV